MMPDGIHQGRQRETLIRLPLADLVGWRLVVSCVACRVDRIVMVADLATRYGAERTLAVLVPRLRCREPTCGPPPTRVTLRNRHPEQKDGPVPV